MPITTLQIDAILDVVQKSIDMDLTGYRRPTLSRRVSGRLAQVGMDAEQYIALCQTDAAECVNLLHSIAIHVSSFFRNPVVFELIAQSVLPRLLGKKDPLRVWSAGCAAGEEAYSMAILIQEELEKPKNTDLHPVIFATDIDRDILKKAEKAFYSKESLKETKLRLIEPYFSPLNDGFQLCSKVKNSVHFSVDDLLAPQTGAPADSIFGSFDIILCRNVLIYFSEKSQKQVFHKLYSSLAKGGYLILGDSETLCRDFKTHFKTIDSSHKIYQRQI